MKFVQGSVNNVKETVFYNQDIMVIVTAIQLTNVLNIVVLMSVKVIVIYVIRILVMMEIISAKNLAIFVNNSVLLKIAKINVNKK